MRPLALVFAFALASCADGGAPRLRSEPSAVEVVRPGTPPGKQPMEVPGRKTVEYTLKARLDPAAHTVAGTGTLRWTNTSEVSTSELWFHLYLNAFKNQRSVFLREPLGPGRGGGAISDWGTIDVRKLFWREANEELWSRAELRRPNDDDETDVRVPLPRAVAPGETITLDLIWDDKLPSVVERTGHAGKFHFVGQWFPKIARLERDGTWAHFPFHRLSEFYSDFGTYDVTLDVPAGFVVGATGPKTEERTEGDRRIERHVQADIHDFAWTAWDGFKEHEEQIGNIAVRSLYPPGYERVAARALEALQRAIPHFEARYGPYPYPTLTVVHPPDAASEAGGMEYPTLITTGGFWWTPSALHTIEAVTIHEFGHQYFYGLLGSNENRYPFLDEGLNTYAEFVSMRELYGAGASFDGLGLKIDGAAIAATFSETGALVQAVGDPAPSFPTFDIYGRLVYLRTAAIIETLARVYGRARTEGALRGYADAHRFGHPTPDDLFRAFAAALGPVPAQNLRAAIAEKGWVDYEVLAITSLRSGDAAGIFDRDGKRETVTAAPAMRGALHDASILIGRKGTLAFPVDIDVIFEDGTTQRLSWDGASPTTKLAVRAASPVRFVNIDPERRVLLDQNPRNNYALGPQGGRASTSASLERVLYWTEQFLGLVTP